MNATLKRVRQLLAPPAEPTEVFHMDRPTEVFKLPEALKFDPSDIETNFAQAAMENTMNLTRETSLAEALNASLNEHAGKVASVIDQIKDEQNVADEAHKDAIAALNAEIAERNKVHAELTDYNTARIVDATLTLQAIDTATAKLTSNVPAEAPKTNVRALKAEKPGNQS